MNQKDIELTDSFFHSCQKKLLKAYSIFEDFQHDQAIQFSPFLHVFILPA